jgi:hypothetical protein
MRDIGEIGGYRRDLLCFLMKALLYSIRPVSMFSLEPFMGDKVSRKTV